LEGAAGPQGERGTDGTNGLDGTGIPQGRRTESNGVDAVRLLSSPVYGAYGARTVINRTTPTLARSQCYGGQRRRAFSPLLTSTAPHTLADTGGEFVAAYAAGPYAVVLAVEVAQLAARGRHQRVARAGTDVMHHSAEACGGVLPVGEIRTSAIAFEDHGPIRAKRFAVLFPWWGYWCAAAPSRSRIARLRSPPTREFGKGFWGHRG
jgi:hypothetical protein